MSDETEKQFKAEYMKILIIDDERSIRNSLKEILADEGYEVEVAENGIQGCEMADKEKYNVIFCDIKMPEMDGMDLLIASISASRMLSSLISSTLASAMQYAMAFSII